LGSTVNYKVDTGIARAICWEAIERYWTQTQAKRVYLVWVTVRRGYLKQRNLLQELTFSCPLLIFKDLGLPPHQG